MPICPMEVSFFGAVCARKKTKDIKHVVDKQSKCFGEIFKGRLVLMKNLEIF